MKTISITIDEELLQGIDRQARGARKTRSEMFRVALREWLAAHRRRQAAAGDRAGYQKHPVRADEFGGLIAAQPFDEEWQR